VRDLPLFLGRFHAVLVHLPIGLLLAVGGLEVWARWRRRGERSVRIEEAIGPLLGLAATGAVLAAADGLLLGRSGGYAGDAFERHRALGLGLVASVLLTAVAWLVARRHPSRGWSVAYGVLLVHTLVLLVGTGHAGGTLSHGEGYLVEFAPPPLRAWLTGEVVAMEEERRPAQRVVFHALIQPILEERCVPCHGGERPRGGLELDSAEGLVAGGDEGPVVDAGSPASSELWRRVALPPSHADAMPPRGRHPLTAAEGALLRWWILEGASFDATLAEVDVTAEVRPTVEALVGSLPLPGPTLPPASVPSADPGAVAAAEDAGFSVRPVAEGVSFLRVSCGRPTLEEDDLQALVPLAEQIVWLDLGRSPLDDRGLERVGALRHLVRLDLSRTRVTDDGLAHLQGLLHLESLNLHDTAVTDAGLTHLEALEGLRRLYLWRTATTPDGVDRLRLARPDLEVTTGRGPAGP
jgi:uncharacterized membrane protein